jgi:hypothetical protein
MQVLKDVFKRDRVHKDGTAKICMASVVLMGAAKDLFTSRLIIAMEVQFNDYETDNNVDHFSAA